MTHDIMLNYTQLFTTLEAHANPTQARKMSAYMRDQFPYLGIPTPRRRELTRAFLVAAKKEAGVDWAFVRACWDKAEREFQDLAMDYLLAIKDRLTAADIPALRELCVTKSWWDTIDGLDMVIGHIAQRFPEVKQTLLAWSLDKNFWLRRVAIDHQLGYRDKTDTALLETIIKNNFGQTEFFINKAIGWSLREYSKTNPTWVRDFIERHRADLAPISVREGSKYI